MAEHPNGKRYISWQRILLWCCAFPCLWIVPNILESVGVIEAGERFIVFFLVLTALAVVFFDKLSFRAGVIIVVICGAFSVYQPVFLREVIDGLGFRMIDVFFTFRGPIKPTGQVVIIDIDQKSLSEIGQWPVPRTEIARLIRNCKNDGARTVGFDIVFAESDRNSLKDWAFRFQQMGIVMTLPGMTLEESRDGIIHGWWEVMVPGAVLKEDMLRDWERTFAQEDPLFVIDYSGGAESRELQIVERFIEREWAQWEQREELMQKRVAQVGGAYEMKEYTPPSDPLYAMAVQSTDLFYIAADKQDSTWYRFDAPLIIDNDYELGIAFAEGRVVAGGFLRMLTSAGTKGDRYREQVALEESDGMVVSAGLQRIDEFFPERRTAIGQVLNIPEIQEMTYHQGMFNIVPDPSGAARYYTMFIRAPVFQSTLVLKEEIENPSPEELMNPDNYDTQIISHYVDYPSLVLEMLRAANGYDIVEAGIGATGKNGLILRRKNGFVYEDSHREQENYYSQGVFPYILPEEKFIPLDFKGDLQVNFLGYGGRWEPEYTHGPDYYFTYVSFSDVLFNRFVPGTFRDKYVIVGSTDPTLHDLVGSPFRAAFPGLEVHAVVLDNMISESYLLDPGDIGTLFTFFSILLGGVLLTFFVAYTGSLFSGIVAIAVLVALPALSYLSMVHLCLIIDFIYPWFCVVLISGTVIVANLFTEGRERSFVVAQFSQMVSKDILDKLHDDPHSIALGGQRAAISVMFSDIANFTTISEGLPPQDLVQVLNDYLTPMADIILSSHGFIDKFIGDAIMACWGVPFPDEQHAVKACYACIEQQQRLLVIAQEIKSKYKIDIAVRMGVATGEVSAAMMGSESRKNYTVMGDTVNLGSRLEPVAKDYKAKILISENTYLQAQEKIEARCVDKIVVKGKTVPISIYELIGKKGEVSDEILQKVALFEEALRLHWEREWDAALYKLQEILVLDPNDYPTRNLMERIALYQQHPPHPEWHGEWVKRTK